MQILSFSKVLAQVLIEKGNVVVEMANQQRIFGDAVKYKYNPELDKSVVNLEYNGQNFQYEKPMEVFSFINFLSNTHELTDEVLKSMEFLKETAKKAKSAPSIEEMIKSGYFNVVLVNTDNVNVIKELSLVENRPENMKVVVNTDKELAKKANMNFPGLSVYNSDDNYFYQAPIPANESDIFSGPQLSVLNSISDSNLKIYQQYSGNIIHFITDEEGSNEEIRKKYLPYFLKFSPQLKVILSKTLDNSYLTEILGIKQNEYPVLCKFEQKGKKYLVKNVSVENIDSGVNDLIEKRAPRVYKNETIPVDNEEKGLRVANYQTYISDVIEDDSTNRVLMFTSPHCVYCTDVKPVYEKFGKLAKEHTIDLKLYNYDVLNNELPDYSEVNLENGVPKIYFIPKGTTKLECISSLRKIEDLIKFMKDKVERIDEIENKEFEDTKEEKISAEEFLESIKEKLTEDEKTNQLANTNEKEVL